MIIFHNGAKMMYTYFMIKKAISKTNKYFKDPSTRRSMIALTVATSTAVEGVHVTTRKSSAKRAVKRK